MLPWRDAPSVDIAPFSDLGLEPILARALLRRGITGSAAAESFLQSESASLTDPLQLPGMAEAISRVQAAIRRGESICIWGDFDVDGQTATTVLVQALSLLGAPPNSHVPLRAREGHGVHVDSLKGILDRGVQLVITCDTGITAHEAVEYARSRGVDFVITDHHELGPDLPSACAVVDPRLLPAQHPLANLAGVGVAYEVARALLESQGVDTTPLLDLVALGLIADVALLKGDTRSLSQKGISALRATRRLGIQTMADLARVDLRTLTEETIGFELAPRLNAVGRLGDANQAVEFLLTQDRMRANVLAAQIEGLNIRRRLLTEQVLGAAEEMLRADPSLLSRPALILAQPSWPGGVLGIVAAQLVRQHEKPVLLLSSADDGRLHGSARSIEGVDITAAIAANAGSLLGFGGHPMAAGVSLEADRFPKFQRDLEATISRMLDAAHLPEAALTIDEWLPLEQLTLDLADRLTPLAPFGAGNPALVFASANVRLASSRDIGRTGKHRKLTIDDGQGVQREVLWWNAGQEDLPEGAFDLAYSVRATTYAGERQLSIEYRDARPVVQPEIEVREARPEVVDLRGQVASAQLPPSCLVWAEGTEKKRGVDRLHLHPSDDFAIWTSPPCRADLQSAVSVAGAHRIYLVGVAPLPQSAENFLTQLAGLAKFAMNQRAGRVVPAELAAALAQRELAVRLGLEWLAAGGHVRIEETEDGLRLAPGNSAPDKRVQRELLAGVRSVLEETSAYRSYFSRVTPEQLLDF